VSRDTIFIVRVNRPLVSVQTIPLKIVFSLQAQYTDLQDDGVLLILRLMDLVTILQSSISAEKVFGKNVYPRILDAKSPKN
jgi:hypothetical protein